MKILKLKSTLSEMKNSIEELNSRFEVAEEKESANWPWPVTQLVRALSWYAKVVGSTPGHSTYKNQSMNA